MQNTKSVNKNFMQAPNSILRELNNLFFELNPKGAEKKQNSILSGKKSNNCIKIEKIKNALIQSKKEELKSIYLIGGEPLYHPDFNSILRMCLKFANTTIITNGTPINEKKARFLRKIDDENKFEAIFRINLAHWNEVKNDSIRGYGNFRRVISAINSLSKYGFNPIINFINVYNESDRDSFEGFRDVFQRHDLMFEDINLKIIDNIEAQDINIEGLKDNKLNFLSVINFELKFSSKMIFLMKSNDAK